MTAFLMLQAVEFLITVQADIQTKLVDVLDRFSASRSTKTRKERDKENSNCKQILQGKPLQKSQYVFFFYLQVVGFALIILELRFFKCHMSLLQQQLMINNLCQIYLQSL